MKMKPNLFSFLFLISVNLFYYAPNTTAFPIIHGVPADQRFWLFHVSIHKKIDPQNVYKYACGGSIISEKHILTSGHCFVKKTGIVIEEFFYPCGRAKIIAGTNQRDGPGIERDIIKVFIPAAANRHILSVDLAVAELSQNLDVNHPPDRLAIMRYGVLDPFNRAIINQRARFCGFGYDVLVLKPNGRIGPASSSTINRFMNVKIVDRNLCGLSSASGICVTNADPRDTFRTACSGDSGAGLIYHNTIIGVLSQGPRNCDTSDPIKFEKLYGNMRFLSEALSRVGYHSDMHVLETANNSSCTIH